MRRIYNLIEHNVNINIQLILLILFLIVLIKIQRKMLINNNI